jgi:hypothetical protein
MKRKSTEKLDNERLSQVVLAKLLSVDVRTIRYWHEDPDEFTRPPRNRDGTYNLQAIVWWMRRTGRRCGSGG